MKPHAYYPLFADLTGRLCVVIGGGSIAQRKVATLLRYGAAVTVVSPTLTKRLTASVRQGRVRHLARPFQPNDLRGAWLVCAATDDQAINVHVFREASRRRVFTNVVDQPALCSFIAPALFRRGALTVAVSTGGTSPSLAKQVCRDLERTISSDYVPLLRLLTSLRGLAKRRLPNFASRKRYFHRVITGAVFRLIREGKTTQARRTALDLLERAAISNGHA